MQYDESVSGFTGRALASLGVTFPPWLPSSGYTVLRPITVGHKTARSILATVQSWNVGRCRYNALRVICPHLVALWLHLSRAVLPTIGGASEWIGVEPSVLCR